MKKIIEWISHLPEEARTKVNNYLDTYLDTDETLDTLNQPVDTLEIAVFRCLPDELNEPFEYWYSIIHS